MQIIYGKLYYTKCHEYILFTENKMAAKEIKSELKSARDAIQNKDFQTALKHCKVCILSFASSLKITRSWKIYTEINKILYYCCLKCCCLKCCSLKCCSVPDWKVCKIHGGILAGILAAIDQKVRGGERQTFQSGFSVQSVDYCYCTVSVSECH